jgi:hypothetical protein
MMNSKRVIAMNRQRIFPLLGFCLLAVFLFATATAAGADDIRERMAARLPEVMALKEKGVIGEDSQGFLQFVGGAREKAELVQAENGDRLRVYQAIARQQNTTVELVGRRRAQQIADIAQPGHWLQDLAGGWKQK